MTSKSVKFISNGGEWIISKMRGYPSGQRGRRVIVRVDEEIAELIGIHLGDGCLSVTNTYQEYALSGDLTEEREYYEKRVIPLFNRKIMVPLLGKPVKGKPDPSNGVYGFHVFKPEVVRFFCDLGFQPGTKREALIPREIAKYRALVKKVLRGLFDTDGTLYFEKNYSVHQSRHKRPKIKLGTTSKKLALQVKIILEELGFKPMWKKSYKGKRDQNPVYSIVIHRKTDIQKWLNEIKFKNPKHQSKIQVWKKLGYCPPKTTLIERRGIISH